MKWNLISLFLVAVIGSLGAIYWKVDRDFYTQKINWNESQSRAQISALGHSVDSEIEGLAQVLDLAYPIVSEMKRNYGEDQVFSKFQMIGRLQKAETGDLLFENKFYLEKTSVQSWASHYAYFAIKNLKSADFEKAKVMVLQDPQRKPWLLLVVKSVVTQNTYAAILAKDFFQSIVDRQKGQAGTVSILNEQGQVIAHSTPEYIGMDLQEDELVQEIMTSTRQNGSGFFQGLEGETTHGFFEKSAQNDFYISISTPVSQLMSERSGLKKKFILMGIGIIFVGLAFLFFMDPGAKEQDQNEELLSMIKRVPKNQEASPIAKTSEPIPAAAKPAEKPKPEIRMMPPPPPGKEDAGAKAGFEQLFSARKIEEAFDMIDNLDAPPRDLKIIEDEPSLSAPKAPELEPNEKLEVVAPIAKPLIEMKRRESKLDQFEVQIRNAGEKL